MIRDDGEEVTETVWEDDGAGSPNAEPAPVHPASAKVVSRSVCWSTGGKCVNLSVKCRRHARHVYI